MTDAPQTDHPINKSWNWHPELPLENSPLFSLATPTGQYRALVCALLAEIVDDADHTGNISFCLGSPATTIGASQKSRIWLDRDGGSS